MLQRFLVALAAFRFIWKIYPQHFMIEVVTEDAVCEPKTCRGAKANFMVAPDDFESAALVDYSEYRNITKH